MTITYGAHDYGLEGQPWQDTRIIPNHGQPALVTQPVAGEYHVLVDGERWGPIFSSLENAYAVFSEQWFPK